MRPSRAPQTLDELTALNNSTRQRVDALQRGPELLPAQLPRLLHVRNLSDSLTTAIAAEYEASGWWGPGPAVEAESIAPAATRAGAGNYSQEARWLSQHAPQLQALLEPAAWLPSEGRLLSARISNASALERDCREREAENWTGWRLPPARML